ncbi:DUF1254 domain-containing protein [Agarivorans sp. B2Z047]|uniref:DUF1254 domain-containing protein n=1 Tax=Agarivorans sp. B2Z047 TaxID=2652721 RepID=UPI00128DD001|nr:DUF1254 domain-containing protein [Agarivorans sp. B2Z047]MPW30803.1 DUF1254 domain-containing protein [Agarivorans sp. B2Z047]UQN40967.1 DUF1254 domain-containing protein [Agarivorans sp. B2Z047]
MNKPKRFSAAVAYFSASAFAQDVIPVNIGNYIRAETDIMIKANLVMFGDKKGGEIIHLRQPTPPEQQPVIRMNRDTIYSAIVIDLSSPATITLPKVDWHYQSMMVTSQDHYTTAFAKPGEYVLRKEDIGSRYAFVAFRTLVNGGVRDLELAHKAQDAIVIDTPYIQSDLELPNWNKDQVEAIRSSINTIATLGFSAELAFGTPEQVEPIAHLIGIAAGWGACQKLRQCRTLILSNKIMAQHHIA